ncbi:MAG: hypothetical protein LBH42_03995 [Treponema sp.]|jgi:DNA-directed RNA polymerase alpha subunit|nr:hypothetical protein [Treponema sp.]
MPRYVGYSHYEHEKATLCYTVRVAPENVLDGPISDFFAYIKTLKAAGIKNSEGENVNFDYVFNFAVEKRNRFLLKNNELLTLKLPARVISVLDERDIHTIHQLKKMSVQELMSIQNIGHKMITETLAILSEAGITLQEEKREGGKYETKIHQA